MNIKDVVIKGVGLAVGVRRKNSHRHNNNGETSEGHVYRKTHTQLHIDQDESGLSI